MSETSSPEAVNWFARTSISVRIDRDTSARCHTYPATQPILSLSSPTLSLALTAATPTQGARPTAEQVRAAKAFAAAAAEFAEALDEFAAKCDAGLVSA